MFVDPFNIFYQKTFCFVLCMGNVKTDCHSNMKLLIVFKLPSKFGWSSLQGITGRKHTREQTRINVKSNIVSFQTHFKQQRTCEVDTMGENSSFIFICYVKIVPVYNFKLVLVALHCLTKNFSKRFTNKSRIMMFYS